MSEGINEEKVIDRVMMIDQWKVSGDVYTQDELDAIGSLLDLYQKEKEKNKRQAEHIKNINKRNENQRMQLKLLQAHKLKKYMMDNYISKDKIREIIKEINNKGFNNEINYSEFYYKTEVLKELLEENNGEND